MLAHRVLGAARSDWPMKCGYIYSIILDQLWVRRTRILCKRQIVREEFRSH